MLPSRTMSVPQQPQGSQKGTHTPRGAQGGDSGAEVVIPSWYQREGYIKAMANLIENELKGFDCPEEVMIFFSAHGMPLAYVEEADDPYKAKMEECVDLIMEELEKTKITNAYTLAY
ncbi:Ferrochelatase-2, chloroplastic [Glycine soja]